MKRILNHIFLIAAVLCVSAACTKSGPDGTVSGTLDLLSFAVTDAGYVQADRNTPSGAPSTRAVEEGYATKFKPGDECGLFIVRGGKIEYANVKLTAADDGAEGVVWTPADGLQAMSNDVFYLYYPWKETPQGAPAKGTSFAGGSDDAFFAAMSAAWQPAADQGDYDTGYTASDLMTGKADAEILSEGVATLSFGMLHRMALAVITLPVNPDAGAVDGLSVTFDAGAVPYADKEGRYRYIVNPATGAEILGCYENNGLHEFEIVIAAEELAGGSYTNYKVDSQAL